MHQKLQSSGHIAAHRIWASLLALGNPCSAPSSHWGHLFDRFLGGTCRPGHLACCCSQNVCHWSHVKAKGPTWRDEAGHSMSWPPSLHCRKGSCWGGGRLMPGCSCPAAVRGSLLKPKPSAASSAFCSDSTYTQNFRLNQTGKNVRRTFLAPTRHSRPSPSLLLHVRI